MSDSGTDHPIKQLFKAVDPEGQVPDADQEALLNALEDLMGEDWGEVNQQLGSLLEDPKMQDMLQIPMSVAAPAIATTADPSILSRLSRNIEAATGLVAQLPNPADPDSLKLLRQIDFHLAEASLGIGDLQEASVQSGKNSEASLTPSTQAETKTTKPPVRKGRVPWQVLIGASCLLLPFAIKFGLPHLVATAPLATTQSTNPLYTVTEIETGSLQLQRPDGTKIRVRLLGITAGDGQWQDESTGVLVMLLKASKGQVQIKPVIPQTAQGEVRQDSLPMGVIAQLPNGTSLQEILLSNGLVRLNETELSVMPVQLVQQLRAAQASAQAQHKNIWGDSP